MTRLLLIHIILLFPSIKNIAQNSTGSKTPRLTTIFHNLGENKVKIRIYQYGINKQPFFISLHDDEITSITATQKLLEREGGVLVRIDNNNKRNIRFKLNTQFYTFDPNRIFSQEGINQTLAVFGKTHPKAIEEIEKFANRILKLLPESPDCIISLHNNTNDKFSINSYLPGMEREKDAKAIRVVPGQDPDDLFLTTETRFYEKLVNSGFNVVLQDNEKAKKDGSLSIYCGERNIPYLNCETEHGRLAQYSTMITYAVNNLKKESLFVYKFQIPDSINSVIPIAKNDTIYFGDKKVGKVASFTNNNKSGELEMIESFALYDNMDFFIFPNPTHSSRIEIRIDPTRPRKKYALDKAVIPMKIVN